MKYKRIIQVIIILISSGLSQGGFKYFGSVAHSGSNYNIAQAEIKGIRSDGGLVVLENQEGFSTFGVSVQGSVSFLDVQDSKLGGDDGSTGPGPSPMSFIGKNGQIVKVNVDNGSIYVSQPSFEIIFPESRSGNLVFGRNTGSSLLLLRVDENSEALFAVDTVHLNFPDIYKGPLNQNPGFLSRLDRDTLVIVTPDTLTDRANAPVKLPLNTGLLYTRLEGYWFSESRDTVYLATVEENGAQFFLHLKVYQLAPGFSSVELIDNIQVTELFASARF